MAVFRVARINDYTVMSNFHLRDKRLSLKAKGLLSQMLSLPENWDYTLTGLCYINKESKDAIRTAIHELEQAGYIRRRQTTDSSGKFSSNEYTIYEQPQEETVPALAQSSSEKTATAMPSAEKPTEINIDKQKTDKQKTDSILLIRDNIQYPLLVAQNPDDAGLINEIVELMTETVCARRKTTRVCGADFPAEVVKSQLLKLDAEHIRFVLKCLRENTSKIKNIKQYLLATLYNAPLTINSYYSALVSHDLAEPAGKETAKGVVPMLAH